jgi:hypothetical protein
MNDFYRIIRRVDIVKVEERCCIIGHYIIEIIVQRLLSFFLLREVGDRRKVVNCGERDFRSFRRGEESVVICV